MTIHSGLTGIEKAATALAALSLAVVALMTAASVILRALGLNLPDAIDFSSLFMAVAVFWGMVGAVLRGELIAVDFLSHALNPTSRRRLEAGAGMVTLLFLLLMAYAGFEQIARVMDSGEVTPELRVPLWPFLAIALLGLVAVAAAALFRLIRLGALENGGASGE